MLGGRAPCRAAVLDPASLPEGGRAAGRASPGDCQSLRGQLHADRPSREQSPSAEIKGQGALGFLLVYGSASCCEVRGVAWLLP